MDCISACNTSRGSTCKDKYSLTKSWFIFNGTSVEGLPLWNPSEGSHWFVVELKCCTEYNLFWAVEPILKSPKSKDSEEVISFWLAEYRKPVPVSTNSVSPKGDRNITSPSVLSVPGVGSAMGTM